MKQFTKKAAMILLPLLLVAASVGSFIYANKIVGVYSQQNWLLNGDFEKNTYGSGLISGGSTSLSITNDPSIFGNALLVTSPATNAEIVFGIDSNIGSKLSGLNCEARFNLNLFSSNLTPTVVEVDVIRNAGSLRLSNVQTITMRQSGWTPMSVNFPCASVISASSARIKVTSAGSVASGNVEFVVDSMYVGEATNITNQVVVTDWQDFPSVAAGTLITATTTNPTYGTVVTNKAQYRYVGSDVEIKWDYRQSSAGTAGSGTYLFNIPSSICVIDTVKAKANTGIALDTDFSDSKVGDFMARFAYSVEGDVTVYDSSRIKAFGVYTNGTTTDRTSWSSGAFAFNNAILAVSINAKLPCVGRSATQSAITQQCIQDGSCENVFSAQVSSGGVVSGENIDFIDGDCVWSPVGTATCTVKTGWFGATPNCISNAQQDPSNRVNFIQGSSSATSLVFKGADGSTLINNANRSFTFTCQRSSTDYKPRFAAPVLVGSVTSNSSSALRVETIKYGGASENTLCTSGTCTLYGFGNNGWASSITRSGTGAYTLNISNGVFSSRPNCFGSFSNNSSTIASLIQFSSDTVVVVNTSSISAVVDTYGSIFCIGPR